MKDGFYICMDTHKREIFEIKEGIFYTHKVFRKEYKTKKWIEQKIYTRPTRFGPVSAATDWLEKNKDIISEYTEEDMFLLML